MNEENTEFLNDDQNPRIYCANCHHCVIVKQPLEQSEEKYLLRVKCNKMQWRKKMGEEKMYKYFTVARRVMDHCQYYEPMGDEREFLKDLRKSLPITDEIYSI